MATTRSAAESPRTPGRYAISITTAPWQLREEDVAGRMDDESVWSPVYIEDLIERDTPPQRMYVLQDANFNVTALVDTSGTVQERYIQDPFGSFTVLAANWTTRGSSNYGWVFFFQGKRYDFATGLFASRERDYSPTLGRFIENDPLGFNAGDTNLYRFVANDPTRLSDPLGLEKPKPGAPGWSGWPSWFTAPSLGNPSWTNGYDNPSTFGYPDGSIITINPNGSITWQLPPNGQKPGPSFVFLPDGSASR